ncbi:MAG: TIGR03905 family TSCPD domain-containing protein [Clostridiales bacterium]
MKHTFKTHGTCSSKINFELDGNIVHNVEFVGGCSGNTQGIERLVEGMTIDEVVERLEHIKCGRKATSCPDQLTKALAEAKNTINP